MRKRFTRKSEMNSDMVLQITSMADIFTILLVFLLKSFSTGVSTISPTKNLVLPAAEKTDPVVDTTKLEVSEGSILLDEKPVTSLRQFHFEPTDYAADGSAQSLNQAFVKLKERNTLRKDNSLLIMADESTPFSTVKRVLASASNAGFDDYKLVVAEDK